MPAPWFISEALTRGTFVSRPNRFVVVYRERAGRDRVRGERTAYLSNSGRLGEILVPGVEVLLAARPDSAHGHEVLGACWKRRWPGDTPRVVMLNAGRTNRLVEALLQRRLVPELAGHRLVKREPAWGRGRFDFLLADRAGELLLEVKSVTLAERGLALFPDAASERGRRHLEELAHAAAPPRRRAAALFLVQGHADAFLPDVHNDPAFAAAFLAARERVEILAYAVTPALDAAGRLVFAGRPRRLDIPWSRLEAAAGERGTFVVLADLPRARRIAGQTLPAGHWLHVGEAHDALGERLAAALTPRRRAPSPAQELRAAASWARGLALRGISGACARAGELAALGVERRRLAGETCCAGHLVRCATPPLASAAFQRWLTSTRHSIGAP